MATQSIGQLLEAQHRQIDAGIKGIVDGTGQLAALAGALALLRLHLYVEEAMLFPPLEQSGLAMPVFVMKREHGEMWPLLADLTKGCKTTAPIAALHESALWLFRLLQVHNPKEEEVVYAAADRMLQGPDDPLQATLRAATLPEGWTCALAPR